jgi:3-oxoacyl-[acyl-carrier-protein] synthase-1/3-oxoacyl-[acyl-carrier-protein] synthase II
MRAALADAGLAPADVSYLNLHGTGTRDNDAAEAKAIHQVFAGAPPLVSSTKGLVGHALAASGAIEAALSSAVLATGVIPPNVGLQQVDPELGLDPVRTPTSHPATVVQSNSLGFGGSNASLVLSSGARAMTGDHRPELRPLWVYATGAISGAGVLGATWDALEDGHGPARSGSARSDSARSGSEMYLPDKALAKLLSGHPVRRLGRLFRLALAATLDAAPAPGPLEAPAPGPPGAPATAPPKAPATGPPGAPATAPPEAPATAPPEAPATAPPEAPATGPPEVEGIFYGTGWGALAETHDFLRRLWDSEGAFSSPTAFAASVHNAVAGQLAIHWQARGINLTAVGSRDALAQAALLAALLATERPCWLVAADAHHPELTPRLEGDYAGQPQGAHRAHRALESDGAAALLVRRARRAGPGALARLQVLELSGVPLPGTANRLTPPAGAEQAADAVLLATTEDPRRTTSEEKTSLVVPLHHHLGRHASVAGLGVALAVRALQEGHLPAGLTGTGARPLSRGRILVRSAGSLLAVEAP